MDYCDRCKYAHKIDNNIIWDTGCETMLQEENRVNEQSARSWIHQHREHTFWRDAKEAYLEQENSIECRRFPQFVIRRKLDSCGEWKMG